MNDFKIHAEKRTPITREHFIELGWKDISLDFPNLLPGSFAFMKGNHWIFFFYGNPMYPIPFIKTAPIDPANEDWTPWPELCRNQIKCPTKEALEFLQNLI